MTLRAQKLASPDLFWPLIVRANRYADLLCALFVVAGMAAWWSWSEHGKHAKFAPVPAASRMVWLNDRPANNEEAWRSDVRAISSPILFALPTPLGFSRGALSASGLKPPLPQTVEYFVPQSLSTPTTLVAHIARTLPRDAAAPVRFLALPENDETPATAGATSPVLVVVWQREGIATQTRVLPVESNSVWADVQSWEAVARVDVNTQGWADRVMLEKPSAVTNRNATIVQLLRTMNFGTKGAPNGRVAVRYDAGFVAQTDAPQQTGGDSR